VTLPPGEGDTAAFAHAADAYRNRAPVPIVIAIDPGALFHLRDLKIIGMDGRPLSDLPAYVPKLKSGDSAEAEGIRAARTRIVDYYRGQSHPLAKAVRANAIVNHPGRFMDVTIQVDPGPRAGFGAVTLNGPKTFDPGIARSFIYLEEGELYTPTALAETKLSLRQIPAVSAARVVEGTKLDANGDLPLTIDVGDRAHYAVGVNAQYSTIDGPAAQVYWEDHNVFGGAENLRLEADLLYAPSYAGPTQKIAGISDADLGGRVVAHFMKPAIADTRNDLLIDAYAERVSTNTLDFTGYTVNDVDVATAIRHRFNQYLSAQVGLDGQVGMATDALGTVNYHLIGVPVSLTYDSTDDKLDPTRGFRATGSFAAYPKAFGSSLDLFQAKGRASAYYSIDPESNYVLAGRVNLESEFGAPLDDIPANLRFYSGGGGSVRGYAYNTLGPTGPGGAIIGGRSEFDASGELRVKITDTIGVVPFFDAGNAYWGSEPNFGEPLQMAAGLGLRYYTAIGPLRLDLATPINPRPGDPRFAVYVSIGQAF
jgi:translocation and assembly module TamA